MDFGGLGEEYVRARTGIVGICGMQDDVRRWSHNRNYEPSVESEIARTGRIQRRDRQARAKPLHQHTTYPRLTEARPKPPLHLHLLAPKQRVAS